jgi:hypothetical protein
MKLLTKEFRKDIRGERYRVQVDDESKDHESHCHVFLIAFNRRTLYSCSCDQKSAYIENFNKLRNP